MNAFPVVSIGASGTQHTFLSSKLKDIKTVIKATATFFSDVTARVYRHFLQIISLSSRKVSLSEKLRDSPQTDILD